MIGLANAFYFSVLYYKYEITSVILQDYTVTMFSLRLI